MRVYPDSSVIVSAYSVEVGTATARAWLRSIEGDDMLTSAWCLTEAASAFGGKLRAGTLTADERRQALDAIRAMLAGRASTVPVEQRHFALAADLLTRSDAPLRASDALHLAIASGAGATLVTFDRRMAEAAGGLGLDVTLLR